jgi:hypothetical protein
MSKTLLEIGCADTPVNWQGPEHIMYIGVDPTLRVPAIVNTARTHLECNTLIRQFGLVPTSFEDLPIQELPKPDIIFMANVFGNHKDEECGRATLLGRAFLHLALGGKMVVVENITPLQSKLPSIAERIEPTIRAERGSLRIFAPAEHGFQATYAQFGINSRPAHIDRVLIATKTLHGDNSSYL